MRCIRRYPPAKLVLLIIALLAPIDSASPFPPNPPARNVASRSMIEPTARFPGPVLNADKIRGEPQLQRQLSHSRSYTQSVTKRARSPRISPKKRTLTKPATAFALQVFRATGLITPVELAARYLEDFYDIIALKVETGFWGSVPPMHNLVLKRWNYELTFFCYSAPVPWEFIQEVALEMSSWAERGFTAEFDALYMAVDNLGKEIFVSVVMKLVQGNGLDPIIHT